LLFRPLQVSFNSFSGTASTPEDTFQGGQIILKIEAASINTNNQQRDMHLKGPDFFDAGQFPEITIKTNSIKQVSGDDYVIQADFTLRGITQQVEFKAEYGGKATDGYGNQKVGLEITGKINRKDFGLNWNAVVEGGGLTVSDEVKLIANLQFIQQ
jgi:polyisoprenoid-binding protein YceI